MLQENSINLSIVVPVYNEDIYLYKLYDEVKKYFNEPNIEVVFVNDGSRDLSKKILEDLKNNKHKFKYVLINLKENFGKGYAVREGIENCKGKFILLQDADLELDLRDSKEIYDIISNDKNIDCVFGSRYLSGKLKRHNYFFNELVGKFNTFVFNLFFGQSLTDIHCGLKVFKREIYEKIDLNVNDFGLEIVLASQIIKNNFQVYEVGVSYFSRTVKEGKKITWIDGLKSYYYLFKVRFLDNTKSTLLSILISSLYMAFVGSFFGMGLGNIMFIITFFIIGMIIGLKTKIFSTLLIFLFIYIGSLFGNGQGKSLSVLLFFILGIFVVYQIKKTIKNKNLKLANLF